ncbi:tetrahydrofolate synthase [Nonlabens agnitus]|uniref:Dihydrofolate synthase/folylpolyglutamate synthase n=2 Tax=Nonlabens agnitus TaxID=870484 RepID=A0A2S9WY95_9FLAO|nr:tetrahydrofolate synthase [Nonlabens agnitus]
MTYEQTTEWMFKQLPMYQQVGKSAYKKDLSNSIALDEYLDHPHQYYKTIHVAGTNGKGTTCHMISAVLQAAGYKVGLYTSPHLKDFRERIKINGEMISQQEVIQFIGDHKTYLESNSLSFFEMTVGMAFEAFRKHQVDYAVIETGLGGRLDSTNIITPILSIITSIDLDHTDLLGDTLEKIAFEKSGIIKKNVAVVINEKRSHLRQFFQERANEVGADLYFAYSESKYSSDIFNHTTTEEQNRDLVKKALDVLIDKYEIDLGPNQVSEGLKNYRGLTNFMGRYQIISTNPKVIADVAHNPSGLKMLIEKVEKESYRKLHIVFGAVEGKRLDESLIVLPRDADYYLCSPSISRAVPVTILEKEFTKHELKNNAYDSVELALEGALSHTDEDDLVLVTGSTFVVSEII